MSNILEPEQEAVCVEILDGRLCNLTLARCLEAVRRNDAVLAKGQFKAWCLASTWTLAETSGPQRGGRRGRPAALAAVSERLCFVRQGRWDFLIDQIKADKGADEDTGLRSGKRPRKVESAAAREMARAVAEIQPSP